MIIRPRRSLLFVPGSNLRALEKARMLPVDGVILDLEDAVAPDAKAMARNQVAQIMAADGFGNREMLIRINGLDTPWWIDDLAMAIRATPAGIFIPKVSSCDDLTAVSDRLNDAGAPLSIRVWVMIETALAILRIESLSAQARHAEARLVGYVMGPNDISRETRIRPVAGRSTMLPFYMNCVLAAHAYGLEILDGPYSNFNDEAGFAKECAQSRDMGFDGKTLIHPNQIEACNAAFTPSADEVADAKKILAAFERPENAGRGAIQLNGQMIERLHADMAKRTIAMADAIAAMK